MDHIEEWKKWAVKWFERFLRTVRYFSSCFFFFFYYNKSGPSAESTVTDFNSNRAWNISMPSLKHLRLKFLYIPIFQAQICIYLCILNVIHKQNYSANTLRPLLTSELKNSYGKSCVKPSIKCSFSCKNKKTENVKKEKGRLKND